MTEKKQSRTLDILTDPAFLNEVKADFDRRTKGFVYKSAIPEIIKEPMGLPAGMRHYESIAALKESFYRSADDEGFRK